MNHIEFIAQCVNDLLVQLPPSAKVAVSERANAAMQHIHDLAKAAEAHAQAQINQAASVQHEGGRE